MPLGAASEVKAALAAAMKDPMSHWRPRRLVLARQRPLLRNLRVFGGMRFLSALVFVLADHGRDFEDVEPLAGLVPLGVLAAGAAAFGPRPVRPAAFRRRRA